jgi:hypothetical protein
VQTLPPGLADKLLRQGPAAPPSVSLTSSSGGAASGHPYLEARVPAPGYSYHEAGVPTTSGYPYFHTNPPGQVNPYTEAGTPAPGHPFHEAHVPASGQPYIHGAPTPSPTYSPRAAPGPAWEGGVGSVDDGGRRLRGDVRAPAPSQLVGVDDRGVEPM